MKEMIFSLIGISLLQSLLLLITKDDGQRKILNLIAGTAMATVLIAGITDFDFHTYASTLMREREKIGWDADQIKRDADALRRRYIESECEEYILENASKMQIELSDAQVVLAWNTEGFWYPVHAEITVLDQNQDVSFLKQLLENELGIPEDEQVWRLDDE